MSTLFQPATSNLAWTHIIWSNTNSKIATILISNIHNKLTIILLDISKKNYLYYTHMLLNDIFCLVLMKGNCRNSCVNVRRCRRPLMWSSHTLLSLNVCFLHKSPCRYLFVPSCELYNNKRWKMAIVIDYQGNLQ